MISQRGTKLLLCYAVAGVSACSHGEPSPLAALGPVSRIIVADVSPSPAARAITGPRVDSVVAFSKRSLDWRTSSLTLPSGKFTVRFMRDTMLLAVLWIGPDYVMARRFEGGDTGVRIREASIRELAQLRSWLDLPQLTAWR